MNTATAIAIATEPKPRTGRHALELDGTSYFERWAAKYWRSQEAIERDRLRKGKAAHRAHRTPITGPKVSK